MRRLSRLLIALAIIMGIIVIVPAGVFGGIVVWLKLSQPKNTGDIQLAGLSAPADLVWDDNAVPHIFAGSLRDAYRMMGWVHARDRLWQMETQRRIGQGRLSEVVGSLGLGYDREMRVLGLYRLAEENYAALDPDTRADLDAYTAGVNAYLQHPAAPLPLEFQILGITPEPWRAADTLVWGRLMSLQLSSNYREEAARAELATKVSPEVFKDFFPEGQSGGPITLSGLVGIDWRRFAAHLPPVLGPDHASNEWVVDGALTKTGKPLLANDPHLGLSAPILWYLARIATPEGNLAGVTFPGVPFHILGHNDHVAWGATTTGGDVQDLFVEDIDPADPSRYKTPDGTAPFTIHDEIIKVRFGKDIRLTVRETRHGPVISDIEPELAKAVGPGKAVALSFVGLEPGDTTVQAIRQMDRAQDWPSFQAALKLWHSPEQNIVYADTDGHIAFTAVGPLPLRKRPTDDFPAPGATGEADWTGLADFSQLPQAVDPADHRFINANNQVVPDDFPTYIGRHYEDRFRAQRIGQLLDGRTDLTADDFASIQQDVKESDADLLLPRLLMAKPASAEGQKALTLLKSWDAMMDRTRPEPLIYIAVVFRLERALIDRRLGRPPGNASAAAFNPALIVRLLDRLSPGEASEVLSGSIDDTVATLIKAYGADIVTWRWGDAHKAALQSQLLGAIPLLGSIFDVSLPASGGPETVNRGALGQNDGVKFPDVHGPGYRGVFDLADLDSSRFIIATGESGDPLSHHFADLSERWRDGASITLSGTADQVAAKGLGRQHFSP